MIRVDLKERSYQIVVGNGITGSLGARCAALRAGTRAFCVIDSFVARRRAGALRRSFAAARIPVTFFAVASGERSKSFDGCRKLLDALARWDRGGRPFIAAVGGGVVGDLAGFCAAVYKRGIPFVQVPTTLLAQVDSSIGGKTAIDLPYGKNLVGAFYQPRLVLSDTALLSSLDRRQFASGMAEAVKYGIISDPALFARIEAEAASLGPSSQSLDFIVSRCSAIKASVVELDERDEKGVRMILNFGHTVGHAVEAAAGFRGYTHGEAVSIGMVCACDISRRLGLLGAADAARIEHTLARLGLPVSIRRRIAFSDIAAFYARDKKFRGSSRLVLLKRIGATRIVEDVPLSLVRRTVVARTVK